MNEEPQQDKESEGTRLSFEVVQKREGLTQYVFPHVLLNINFKQEETRGAPELVYAVFDRDPSEAVLEKSARKIPGVDMSYVVNCIRTMADDIGEARFWAYPYDGDSLGGERRLEQWRKHFKTVEEAPEHGYYIYI
jgi:hypothetical protein